MIKLYILIIILSGHSTSQVGGHGLFMENIPPLNGFNGSFGFRRNTPWLRNQPSVFTGLFNHASKPCKTFTVLQFAIVAVRVWVKVLMKNIDPCIQQNYPSVSFSTQKVARLWSGEQLHFRTIFETKRTWWYYFVNTLKINSTSLDFQLFHNVQPRSCI